MPVVHVTELPLENSTQSLIHSLRQYLRKSKVLDFWIKEIADTRGTDTKEASVEVPSLDDAYTLESYINQKPYEHSGVMFILRAEITEFEEDNDRRARSRSPAWANQRGRGRNQRRNRAQEYDFARSYERQSPLYEDSSKLDHDLQLLRKKRLLIEEERKLLLEQKKLEYIKRFGASAKEFERLKPRDRKRRPIRDDEAPARNPRPPQPMRKAKGLPLFVMPCHLILKQMTELIDTKTEQEDEKHMLEKVLRINLRKKFALALEGKKYLPSNEIVKLYRGKYPESGDEELVTEALEGVRLSLWTSDKFPKYATDAQGKKQSKKIVKEKNQENSGTLKAESNTVKQDPDKIELKQEKVEATEDNGTVISIKEGNTSEVDLSAIEADEPDSNISTKQEEEANLSKNAEEEQEITAKKVSDVNSSAEPEEVNGSVTNGTEEKKANNIDVGAKNSNAMEVDGKVQDKTEDAVDSSAAKTTVESADIGAMFDQLSDTEDDNWIENGIDWNDDNEGKDEQ